MNQKYNPAGIRGIEFVEFTSSEPERLHQLFLSFGFSKTMKHKTKAIDYYCQNDIHFLLNREPNSFASKFESLHGPSICSMGWRVENRQAALEHCTRDAQANPAAYRDLEYEGRPLEAIYGIGESLLYFIDGEKKGDDLYRDLGFVPLKDEEKVEVPSKGLILIDHLTNNVPKGTMEKWTNFYKDIFGFTQIRYFDIRGIKTGLTSFALKSPCGSFAIPINEGTEAKSQINEYLEEYKGAGIQHIAFLTHDIVGTLEELSSTDIETLDIDPSYYEEVFERVPNVTEDREKLKRHQILVDGDIKGYLLQIFTRNVVGPIFIEIIQRKNHYAFGEGNFGALFRSIERDQQKRGYLD